MLPRRYAELLDGHSRLAVAIGAVQMDVKVERIVLRGLKGEGGGGGLHRWGHGAVLALAALRRLLAEDPAALGQHHDEVSARHSATSEQRDLAALTRRRCTSPCPRM